MTSTSLRISTLLLILLMLIPAAAGCGGAASDDDSVTPVTSASGDTSETDAGEYVDTRFVGVNFNGKEFRVQTSVDAYDATNANEFIAGSGEENGEVVNDAVFKRNLTVEELLNVKLKFTESEYTYSTAEGEIRKIVMAGDDLFDLIINDVRSVIALTDENIVWNVANFDNFDYSKPYWYWDSMEDMSLLPGKTFVMAGDYFMDVIRSCHALFYNKNMCEGYFKDANYINNIVLDDAWTYEKATEIVSQCYSDLNGDGKPNEGDQFGMIGHGTWGTLIPFVGSSGVTFIDKTQDPPAFCFDNERSIDYVNALNALYWDPAVLTTITDSSDFNLGLRNMFGEGKALICCYQRLNDLSKMRNFEFDAAIIPYPKLYESDAYHTSIHDTTEMGVIPVTCMDLEFASTCIEALNRETSVMVMPEYYEVALKIKYTHDQIAAQMIDLVHDTISSAFPLAYDMSLNSVMLTSFTDTVAAKSTDFMSTYAGKIAGAEANLLKMIEGIEATTDPVF